MCENQINFFYFDVRIVYMSYEKMFGEDGLSLEKLSLIGRLEKEGITEDVRKAVIHWTEQMEVRSLISAIEMIRFNVDRSELYEAMGDIDEMFWCLDQALVQVQSERDKSVEGGNWDELEEKIKKRVSEMEEKYPS